MDETTTGWLLIDGVTILIMLAVMFWPLNSAEPSCDPHGQPRVDQ